MSGEVAETRQDYKGMRPVGSNRVRSPWAGDPQAGFCRG